jgi:seryl-tRNA synthetase
MLDIKLIRETSDVVRNNLKKRGVPSNLKMLEDLIDRDKKWRLGLTKLNDLRHDRRKITAEIAIAKKNGRDANGEIAKAKGPTRKSPRLKNK